MTKRKVVKALKPLPGDREHVDGPLGTGMWLAKDLDNAQEGLLGVASDCQVLLQYLQYEVKEGRPPSLKTMRLIIACEWLPDQLHKLSSTLEHEFLTRAFQADELQRKTKKKTATKQKKTA